MIIFSRSFNEWVFETERGNRLLHGVELSPPLCYIEHTTLDKPKRTTTVSRPTQTRRLTELDTPHIITNSML